MSNSARLARNRGYGMNLLMALGAVLGTGYFVEQQKWGAAVIGGLVALFFAIQAGALLIAFAIEEHAETIADNREP